MRRFIIPLLAVVSLTYAIYYTISRTPVRAQTIPPAPPPETTSASTVAGEGLVEPSSENISLSCPVSGLVTKLYVRAGDHVRAGQSLFSLDDRELVADLGVKRAALEAARARLAKLQQAPRAEEVPPAEAKVAEAKALVDDAEVQVRLIESVTDKRAVREEDVLRRRFNYEAAKARLVQAEKDLALIQAGTWEPDLAIGKTEVNQAEAAVRQDEINIDRLTMRAPVNGVILQNKVRLGQYAEAGILAEPLMVFGADGNLRLRTDVDESEAWRVNAGSAAVARLRGNSKISFPLEFVRFEPYVIPKKSLTGNVTERVDTRVLQVIYSFKDANAKVFDGQQLDVFIETNANNRQPTGSAK
jgi:multidrug resistance efflux pump